MDHVTTPIQIKGIRDGLLVTMGNGALDETFQALEAELQQKADFLQGSRIVMDVGERPLRKEQLADIQDVFARHRLVLWTVLADREMTRSAARHTLTLRPRWGRPSGGSYWLRWSSAGRNCNHPTRRRVRRLLSPARNRRSVLPTTWRG